MHLKREKDNSVRARVLQRVFEMMKSVEKIRQAELDRFKESNAQLKKKVKDMEEENEVLVEKNHALKKEKANLENDLLFKVFCFGGNEQINDLEKKKLR